ncbi:MAG: DedA family protein [Desulfosarcinaceae bacterium]
MQATARHRAVLHDAPVYPPNPDGDIFHHGEKTLTPNELSQLSPYLQQVQPYLAKYGYWAVLFGVLLEDFGVPVPGETLLIAGALLAAMGHFNLFLLMLLAFIAAVTGDNIGYAIGHFGGRKWAVRYGRYVGLAETRLQKLEGSFQRQGGKIIVVARFVEGLRQFNGFIAGTLKMDWTRFLAFNVAGAGLWVGFWSLAAYFLGGHLATAFAHYHRLELVLITVAVLAAVAYLIYRLLVKRRRKY